MKLCETIKPPPEKWGQDALYFAQRRRYSNALFCMRKMTSLSHNERALKIILLLEVGEPIRALAEIPTKRTSQ